MSSHTMEISDPDDARFSSLQAILANGQVGVEIFFVISGFLITTLLMKELRTSGRISLRDFYARRALRILPPYYAFLLSILIASRLHWTPVDLTEWTSSLLFVWNYVPSAQSWWLGHTWSLCVEEQFYLLWPLVLAGMGEIGARRVAVAIVALAPLFRIVSYFALPAFRSKLTFFLSTRADGLMIGCLLALWAAEPWFERAVEQVCRSSISFLCALFIFVISPILFSQFEFAYQMTAGYTLEVLSIAVLVTWAVRNPGAGFARILNWKPVMFVGVLSYSLYLWQQPFMRQQDTWITAFPYNVLVVCALAAASYYLLEQPAARLRRRLLPSPAGPLRARTAHAGGEGGAS